MEQLDHAVAIDPTEDDAVARDLFEDPAPPAQPIDPDLLEEMMTVLAPGTPLPGQGQPARRIPVATR